MNTVASKDKKNTKFTDKHTYKLKTVCFPITHSEWRR